MAKPKRNGNGSAGHNSGALWLRRSYNFVDKDPEIDRFRTLWQKEHLQEVDFAALAGLSPSTVHNMFGGKTKQPRHSTFAKMAGAMGYRYDLVRGEDERPNYEREIPRARTQLKEYRAMLAKKRERTETAAKK